MELLKAGSLSPILVLDLLLRGEAAIPGVHLIGERVGSRGVVVGFDADTVYTIRVGATPSEVLLAALQDLAWLKEEESLVRAIFPQTARPLTGVILAADLFPSGFSSLLQVFSFPCRFFRWIALGDLACPALVFEPYPPPISGSGTAVERTTEEEERFFSSW
ncbi:MAG TPA: hypothetical protein VLA67_06950 [Nitrospiraceae bacterium]|nr:hypothetical protein [Nitrospiraceae bacterium]